MRLVALLALAACSRGDGVVDLDGHAAALAQGPSATVLVFLATSCPISTRYLPELARIRSQFADRGVAFDAIYPDDERPSEVPGYATLRDPKHALVERVGATITPEAVVLGPRGEVRYRGRIDNWFTDFGRSRPAPTHHDLQDALEAVLAGRAPVAGIAPVGCAITD